MTVVAALFVEDGGAYAGLDGVDCWPVERDARGYAGPHPVVAHPPCARWTKATVFAEGGFKRRGAFRIGDDGGCFAAALSALHRYGGVLEHPAHTRAFHAYGLPRPPDAGWQRSLCGVWVCTVWQGLYGHRAAKPTWLAYVGARAPRPLRWGPPAEPSRVYASSIVRGADRRRVEWMCPRERSATPAAFRDVLLDLARNAS